MNEKTGKLLVLGGFAGKVLTSFISFILYLVRSYELTSTFSSIQNAANLVTTLAIAAGFGIVFLSEHSMLDLVASGGYAVGALVSILSIVAASMIYGSPDLYRTISMVISLLSFIAIVGPGAWAFRLFQSSNQIAAIAVAGACAASFLSGLLLGSGLLPGSMIFESIRYLINIASMCAYAFAAFLDSQS